MLRLEPNQVCPYKNKCPYNVYNECLGAIENSRTILFECDYITNGVFVENGQVRTNIDQTGKMKIIME